VKPLGQCDNFFLTWGCLVLSEKTEKFLKILIDAYVITYKVKKILQKIYLFT
jgi:hypothetical protein